MLIVLFCSIIYVLSLSQRNLLCKKKENPLNRVGFLFLILSSTKSKNAIFGCMTRKKNPQGA